MTTRYRGRRRCYVPGVNCSCCVQNVDSFVSGVSRIVFEFPDGAEIVGSIRFDTLDLCMESLQTSRISVTFRSSDQEREFQFSSTTINYITCNTSPPGVSVGGIGFVEGETTPRAFCCWFTHQPSQPYSDSILSDFSIEGLVELSPFQPDLSILPSLRFCGV